MVYAGHDALRTLGDAGGMGDGVLVRSKQLYDPVFVVKTCFLSDISRCERGVGWLGSSPSVKLDIDLSGVHECSVHVLRLMS